MKPKSVFDVTVLLLSMLLSKISSELVESEKVKFCENLQCDLTDNRRVCGIIIENEKPKLRKFDNECKLMQYGCRVDKEKEYGIINMKYCEKDIPNNNNMTYMDKDETNSDCNYCIDNMEDQEICGIEKQGEGFKIRIFKNECQLLKYNCMNNFKFHITDAYICNSLKNEPHNATTDYLEEANDNMNETNEEGKNITNKIKTVVVVDGLIIDRNNINDSIDNFFAATHVFDLPIQDMQPYLNKSMRRMQLSVLEPVQVFKPWVKVPENISEDYEHQPTLSSCFHKCPTKCPETYAPVCGLPGNKAREPTLMFKNHCFMDVAQCKMHWEDKSPTAVSSAYIESSFLFCLGDEMNGLYRFLPLIKTLQHMGRLKKKGKFRYKMKNMRFFNNLLTREPNIMG